MAVCAGCGIDTDVSVFVDGFPFCSFCTEDYCEDHPDAVERTLPIVKVEVVNG
jgi:hypothetical protein